MHELHPWFVIIQPAGEHLPRTLFQLCAVARRLFTQALGRDAGQFQLAGMANQPAFDIAMICLQMELQAERKPLIVEGLMRANRRAGQAAGALRDREHIAVPMQHRRIGQRRQRRVVLCR